MKTLAILILSLCWLGANATSWRVNSNPQVNAHFVSINEAVAHYTVVNGDTLYLENGSYFAATTLTKSLTLIGPGYFLLENDSTYANPLPVLIASITFSNGSSGSKIIGVQVIGNASFNSASTNITIERSYLGGVSGSIYGPSGLTIRQCYVVGSISGSSILSSTIYNNIIIGSISLTSSDGNHNIYNNVIYLNSTGTFYALAAKNSSVLNNIIIREPYSLDPGVNRAEYCIDFSSANNSNSSFVRNVMSQSANITFPENIWNSDKESNFVLVGSTDEKWKLAAGSPGLGYGSNGDDCGAFGGAVKYVLSGLPWLVPRIFEAEIPASGSGNMIPVHIKAKTQEE
ncbi:MAG: hypothetical protein IH598_07870 [Bacteroidales bacterium]|nr:hypothetical protein [Bacteroidales bacterium]